MALITKESLIETTKYIKDFQFEARHSNLIRQMQEAANEGKDYVTFEQRNLSDEFIAWLCKEKFQVYGLDDSGFIKYWERINDFTCIGAYYTIRISWEN